MSPNSGDQRASRLGITHASSIKGYRFTLPSDPVGPVSPIGYGGSSVVYRAYQELDSSRSIFVPRAIKFFVMREDLNPADAETSFLPANTNFLQEISTVSQLSHENLVQIVDAGEYSIPDKQVPYIVSHLVDGCTLRDIISATDSSVFARSLLREQPEQAVTILTQIANGLGYLHSRGMLHCDIAPKNIFIEGTPNLRAIVGDVGMARSVQRTPNSRIYIAGTRSYTPTEISGCFGKEVSADQLGAWFPYWDLYGFAKTARELLGFVATLSSAPWLLAAVAKSETALARCKNLSTSSAVVEHVEYCLPVHRQRGGIPELEPSAVLSRKRMMPIGALSLTDRIDKLVQHRALTRLQLVPQLTIVRSIAPGGNHTRYEHSLGVMENVRRMLSTLIDEPSFLGILTKDSIETGLLAGLLYNVHRFPFSNIVHEINRRVPPGSSKIFPNFSRTTLLAEVLGPHFASSRGRTLEEQIAGDFPSVDIDKLRRILTTDDASKLEQADESALYTLLNSSLDARVIDFVRRDSLHLGLSSGDAFELDDLLPHLTIVTGSEDRRRSQVTLKSSGISVAEQIILMRYWLYQRVYWNQQNRAYNAAIRRALLDLRSIDGFQKDLRRIALGSDEQNILKFLRKSSSRAGLVTTTALLNDVYTTEKTLYREVFSRNIRQSQEDATLLDSVDLEKLVSPTMSYETMHIFENELARVVQRLHGLDHTEGSPLILLDVPFEPGSNKLGTDIFVTSSFAPGRPNAGLRNLASVSPIVDGVNSNFTQDLQRLRIFARRDLNVKTDEAHELYAELRRMLSA